MTKYPLNFKASAEDRGSSSDGQPVPENPLHIKNRWLTAAVSPADLPSLTAAIPPEFEGPGGGYSPEDFYALALANCYIATFKVIAEKSRFHYGSLSVECSLDVDLNEHKRPWMARATVRSRLMGTDSVERGQRLLEKVSGLCLIHQSIKTEITYDLKCES